MQNAIGVMRVAGAHYGADRLLALYDRLTGGTHG